MLAQWCLRALVLSALLGIAHWAHAADALLHIEGASSKRLGRDIEKALPESIESKPSQAAAALLKQSLRKHPLSKISETPSSDDALVKETRKALRKSKRDLAILVAVGKQRTIRMLLVPEADDGAIFFRETTLPRFQSAEEHVAWWPDLFAEATAPPKPEPEPEPPPPEPPPVVEPPPKPRPEPPPEEAGKKRRADYFLSLGADLGFRQFIDREPATGPTRSYRAFPMFGFHIAAELYPIVSGHIGLEGGYGMALGVHSKSSDGQSLATSSLHAEGGLKFRVFTASRADAPWLALLLGYGYSRFTFDNPPDNREIPTGVYQMLRAGLDGRAPIDRVVLSLGGEYDRLVSIAPLGNVTPASSGNGSTVRAGIAFEIVPDFFARIDGRYTWLRFDVVRDVPANVVDQYLTTSLSGEIAF